MLAHPEGPTGHRLGRLQSSPANRRVLALLNHVCAIAGDRAWITNARAEFIGNGVAAAVAAHDDGPLYDWLIAVFTFQGISDSVARSYWASGGGVTYAEVTAGLGTGRCAKLSSFWSFEGCAFRKSAGSCGNSKALSRCPLPRHDLRNGRLNQAAYSLHLFLRDLCDDDFVGWIDRRLAAAHPGPSRDRISRLGRALIDPLKGVFGVSDKVLSMALSDFLTGADPNRPDWIAAGGGMIVIDTLVHNWFVRTGVLEAFGAGHSYGPACYGPTGCAALVRRLAKSIDARRFNPDHPRTFPRFVQKAIWRFCAMDHDGRCNGVRINDRKPCKDLTCPLGPWCDRAPLGRPTNRGPTPGRSS